MPHYSEDYPAEYYPPYSSYRRHHFQQPPSGQVAPMQYHSRPRRRYSQSQVFDSIAPDMNYPSYITQPQHYGQQERPMMNYPEYSLQRPPPLRQTKATRDPTVTWERSRRGAYQSYPHTSLQQQRQDPKKFQDQRNQYDNNNRQRRSSTGSTWASGYPSSYRMENNDNDYDDYDYNYNNEDYGDDGADDYINSNNDTRKRDDSDDGDSLNSLEMLALENAKRNEKPPGGTPSPFDPDNLSIPLSAQMESSNNNKEQQQRHIATTRPQFEQDGPHHHYHHPTTDDPIISPPIISSAGTLTETLTNSTGSQQQQEPTKKRRWPLSYLFRKSSTGSNFSKTSYNLFMTTPSPSNSLTSSNSSDFSHHTNDSHRHIPTRQKEKQKQPSIVTYQNKMEPTAQTDQQQQRQLGDAEMTALLDNIWCFKASQVAAQLISPDNKSNVWTGFDYKNQEILTNHSIALMNDQAKTDPGLELFDSHIRKGTLPFLVVISQQLAYYPTSNDTIDKIEIKCLPNTKDTVLLRKKKLA